MKRCTWYFSGNVINIQTGEWIGRMSGLGAGLDSFYEYLLKVWRITVAWWKIYMAKFYRTAPIIFLSFLLINKIINTLPNNTCAYKIQLWTKKICEYNFITTLKCRWKHFLAKIKLAFYQATNNALQNFLCTIVAIRFRSHICFHFAPTWSWLDEVGENMYTFIQNICWFHMLLFKGEMTNKKIEVNLFFKCPRIFFSITLGVCFYFQSFILFGNQHDMHIFTEFYDTVKYYMRKG